MVRAKNYNTPGIFIIYSPSDHVTVHPLFLGPLDTVSTFDLALLRTRVRDGNSELTDVTTPIVKLSWNGGGGFFVTRPQTRHFEGVFS